MPDHAHDRYEHASRHGPLYCLGVIVACCAWVARDTKAPIEIYDYTRGVGRTHAYETEEDDHFRSAARDAANRKIDEEV